MYSESDFQKTTSVTRIRIALGVLLICAFLALVISLTALKLKALQMVAGGVGFIVCYFLWSFKIMPWIYYSKFMKELRFGQRRTLDCSFKEISSETRMYDNVEVRDVLVSVGEEEADERLFVLDADKSAPELREGQSIKVTSFGSFVTDITAA